MLKTQLWVSEHTKFRLNNKNSICCKKLQCYTQFLRGSGTLFCIWIQLTVGFDYTNWEDSFLEMRLKCEHPGLEWGWVSQESCNTFISKMFPYLLSLWTVSPRVQLCGNLTLVYFSWQMKCVHCRFPVNYRVHVALPCSGWALLVQSRCPLIHLSLAFLSLWRLTADLNV